MKLRWLIPLLLCTLAFAQGGGIGAQGGAVGPNGGIGAVAAAGYTYTGNSGTANNASAGNLTVTIPSTTSGNLEVCILSTNGPITSVTMGAGTFTIDLNGVPSVIRYYMAHLPSIAGGQTSVTVNANSNTIEDIVCGEFNPGAGTGALDVAVSAYSTGSSGTTWTSNSITTTNANDLIIGLGADETANRTLTATSPDTIVALSGNSTNGHALIMTYHIVSSTGSYAPSGDGVTSGDLWIGGATSYK